MHKRIVLFGLLLSVGQANAAQFGLSLSGATGSAKADQSGNPRVNELDAHTYEINFTINVGKNYDLMNYRLHMGSLFGIAEYPSLTNARGKVPKDNISGAIITNTLGFKFINDPNMRMWLGGSLYTANTSIKGDVSHQSSSFAWGGGPTLGLDLNTDGGPTWAFELGYRFINVSADEDIERDYKLRDVIGRVAILWGDKRRPTVTYPTQPLSAPTPPTPSTEERLRALDQMLFDGVVTNDEYARRRAEILAEH
jgi:hypothetical protein